MAASRPLLDVSGLSCAYTTARGLIRAVENVSFEIHPGQTVGVVGESGSGKSTLALSLLGLLDPPGQMIAGRIDFENQDLRALNETQWRGVRGRRLGMIFQSPETAFNPMATIGQQMRDALQAHESLSNTASKQRAQAALHRVGMPRAMEVMDSYPFELSGGMCQRAALALALLLSPALIVADEPTASLDLLAQAELVKLLIEQRAQHQVSMLIISHDLALIGRLAAHIVVMYAGRIIEAGPAEAVLHRPLHPYTHNLMISMPKLEPAPRHISVVSQSPRTGYTTYGCAYAPRCNWANAQCHANPPALQPIAPLRRVACIQAATFAETGHRTPRSEVKK